MYSGDMVPKFFTLLKQGIPRNQLIQDLMAGMIVGIIALPLSLAFAIASGVSPEKGIITAIVGGLIVSVFGGSRVQIAGPTGAFIVIIFSIIQKYGMTGLYTATLMAGVIMLVMGLLRFGTLLKYIPQTLIIGFTTAIAIIIFTSQVRDFLGLRIDELPEGFAGQWAAYFRHLTTINPWALLVGAVSVLMIVLLPRLSSRFPWPFAALLVTALAVWLLKLPVETISSRFGQITFAVPKLIRLDMSLPVLKELFVPAVSIAILGSLESLLSAVVADSMIGGRHRSNMELAAQGAANVILPLIGGIPATGAIARTAANIKFGGRTPVAGIVHSLFLLCIYLFAMPVIAYIPMSALAAVSMIMAWNMSEMKVFVNSLRINIYEALVLLVTFVLTLATDLTISIPIGFVLSLILFMKRMADSTDISPLLSVKADNDMLFSSEIGEYSENITIYEMNGPMFFGSAHMLLRIKKNETYNAQVIILRFRYVPIMDTSALHRLKDLVRELKKIHCEVVISGANERIARKLLQSGIIVPENLLPTIQEAAVRGKKLLDKMKTT